jgi:hypothetical protein
MIRFYMGLWKGWMLATQETENFSIAKKGDHRLHHGSHEYTHSKVSPAYMRGRAVNRSTSGSSLNCSHSTSSVNTPH